MRVARAYWVARGKKMAFKFKFAAKITLAVVYLMKANLWGNVNTKMYGFIAH